MFDYSGLPTDFGKLFCLHFFLVKLALQLQPGELPSCSSQDS